MYYDFRIAKWDLCKNAILYCVNCHNFDNLECTSCLDGYYLMTDNSCLACTSIYGTNCSTCNLTNCLTCKSGNYLTLNQCKTCISRDPLALTCN